MNLYIKANHPAAIVKSIRPYRYFMQLMVRRPKYRNRRYWAKARLCSIRNLYANNLAHRLINPIINSQLNLMYAYRESWIACSSVEIGYSNRLSTLNRLDAASLKRASVFSPLIRQHIAVEIRHISHYDNRVDSDLYHLIAWCWLSLRGRIIDCQDHLI